MKHIQNNQKSILTIHPPKQPMDFKNSRKKKKSFETFCQMFVISKKKTKPWCMHLKIYRKSIA